MLPNQFMARRIRDLFLEGTWVANTNYRKLLSEVPFFSANQKINGSNSIGLLTFHVAYYVHGLLDVIQGKPLQIKDTLSFTMTPITHENEWETMVDDLLKAAATLALQVAEESPEFLYAPFANGQYGNWEANLNVLIEHGYYHLGQMVLIKKMLESGDA